MKDDAWKKQLVIACLGAFVARLLELAVTPETWSQFWRFLFFNPWYIWVGIFIFVVLRYIHHIHWITHEVVPNMMKRHAELTEANLEAMKSGQDLLMQEIKVRSEADNFLSERISNLESERK